MKVRNKEYLKLLNESFDEIKYIDFIKDLLNLNSADMNIDICDIEIIQNQYKKDINNYKYIAKYNDGLNNIGIFIVNLKSTKARNLQRNFVANLLSTYNLDASIVSFYSDSDTSWRLSFVKKELNYGDNGIKEAITPAKRYSYLVGEHESTHTAQEFLFKLLEIDSRRITVIDIEKVFDVEKVTKKFFEEYKEKYLELKDFLDKNEDFETESKKCDFTSTEFAKKLMGQIVFLYFLQKKGWLGVQLVPNILQIKDYNKLQLLNDGVSKKLINMFYELQEDKYIINKTKIRQADENDLINLSNIFHKTNFDMPWGTGIKNFVRTLYKQAINENKNFFEECLEPFFYKGLNEKRDNQYFSLFNCKIPFLNGGLFEPLNNYRWTSAHFNIPNNLFSNDNKNGILDFLDLYNFTIDEEEPLEKEVAVDPEMLGKIFENLLDIDDRKSKGAFYTPREIVYYMCQESLANYLVNKVGIDYNEIIQFIKYGDLISQHDLDISINNNGINFEVGKSILDNLLKIDKALIDVKIADPAVGSGAFPLGMLTEIVKIRNNISIYLAIQKNLGLINVEELFDTEFFRRDMFDMKLQTIENCIYAVDIESSAIDIAKLRLWLSLIVDYPNIEEPKPLPNLDCKIMQGNSLIDEYEGVPLFSKEILNKHLKNYKRNSSKLDLIKDINIQQSLNFDDSYIDLNKYIEKMLELQKEYFITADNKLKKELKEKIDNIQMGMIEESLKNDSKKLESFKREENNKQKPWFIWELEFYEVYKNNQGFDIVIGNPPYVDSEAMTKTELDKNLRNTYSKKYNTAKGNWDLFILFIELGFVLGNQNSIISFIVPNKLISSNYSKAIRSYINKNSVIEIRDYSNVRVFKEASVYPVTILCEKVKSEKNIKMTVMDGIDSLAWTNEITPKIFYNSIDWDSFFTQKSEVGDLIEKIKLHKKIREYDIIVKGAATVNEAYLLKNIIHDSNNLVNSFKFINTGTIDPFCVLWGSKATQYIKDKYIYPVINKDELKENMNNRYNDSCRQKIIIGGMTKNLECILDENGDYTAGKSTLLIFSDSFNLFYLLGILNSNLMTFYYRIFYNSSSLAGGYYSVNTEQIRDLPIIYDEKYFNDIIDLVKDMSIDFDDKKLKKLNYIIYDLYGLSEKEIDLIEEYISNI